MGALSPLFFWAAVAVGVPVFLHLFQRQQAHRVAFPALRYLERTEREHARRIRLQQLLLLAVRSAVILAVVGAGARLFVRGRGSAHPPTALAVVLDNSMSSGLVVGEARALDQLKRLARRSVAAASDHDRIWVIRAGEPWLPAVPGGPDEALEIVDRTGVSVTAADLSEALARAIELVSSAGLPTREVHLLSDLQASAFPDRGTMPAGDVPVVAWAPRGDPVINHALTRVLVGGGLPPLAGQRSDITVDAAQGAPGDTATTPVRVVLEGRVRGAGAVAPGGSLTLPLPPTQAGWMTGYADADADALRADDRRYFVLRARPAPGVALAGDVGTFVAEAVAVLEAGGRLRRTDIAEANVVIAASGEGMVDMRAAAAVLLLPPEDPTLLPALNRRLQESNIPWRAERVDAEGEATLEGIAVPDVLDGGRARRWYRLALEGDPSSPTQTLAQVAGDPWAVEGTDRLGHRYLLLASPLDAASTSLPLSSAMIRFLDWVTGAWAAAGGQLAERVTGEPLSAPRDADAVRMPSGTEVPVDGTRMVTATGEAGIYAFLSGDSVVAYEALNPPPRESDLTKLEPRALEGAVGSRLTRVGREDEWGGAVFRARQGPELGRWLVLGALVLLFAEAVLAASGRRTRRGRDEPAAEAARGAR